MSDSDFNPIPYKLYNDTPVPCDRETIISLLYEAQASLKTLETLVRCDPEPTLPAVAIVYLEKSRQALLDVMPSLKRH